MLKAADIEVYFKHNNKPARYIEGVITRVDGGWSRTFKTGPYAIYLFRDVPEGEIEIHVTGQTGNDYGIMGSLGVTIHDIYSELELTLAVYGPVIEYPAPKPRQEFMAKAEKHICPNKMVFKKLSEAILERKLLV